MRIDWSEVDLTRPAKDIAEELGITTANVYRRRKALGMKVPHESSGTRPMCGGAKPGAGRPKGSKSAAVPMVQTFIRLRESTQKTLEAAANRRGLTYSEFVRRILEDYNDVE